MPARTSATLRAAWPCRSLASWNVGVNVDALGQSRFPADPSCGRLRLGSWRCFRPHFLLGRTLRSRSSRPAADNVPARRTNCRADCRTQWSSNHSANHRSSDHSCDASPTAGGGLRFAFRTGLGRKWCFIPSSRACLHSWIRLVRPAMLCRIRKVQNNYQIPGTALRGSLFAPSRNTTQHSNSIRSSSRLACLRLHEAQRARDSWRIS